AGISWKIYQDIGDGLDAAGSWGWTPDPFIGNYGDNSLLYFNQYRNALPGSALYEKTRTGTNVANGDTYFDILEADVAAGTLPAVSWIVAPEAFSEHSNWPANFGAWYIAQVLDILTSNPDLWSKTALFITYDENDGFFDHVVPPYAPWSTSVGLSTVDAANEYFGGDDSYGPGPYGLGNRVPMIIVSPWTRGGWVCSETFDHTSLIRFIERRFGEGNLELTETNITPWRRAVCGDLTSAFDFATPNEGLPSLPTTLGYEPPDHDRHEDYVPVPPSTQSVPLQEPGVRPARALPYVLAVSGRIDAGDGRYWLDFLNTGNAAAAFQVYAGNRSDGPWTYTAGAGDEVSDYWSAVAVTHGIYDLSAYGPNGFLRTFAGDMILATDGSSANPEITATYDALSNTLLLHVVNDGAADCTLTLRANHYSDAAPESHTVAAGTSIDIAWPLAASAHWYDITLTSDHDDWYKRRLAGHIETGQPSTSDPAFGLGAARIFADGFD
ncbi:MAG: alkaline phosphatase family protein, partial [Rhodanobacteraceae bacterium]